MCACDATFVCVRCADTPRDDRYRDQPDEPSAAEREQRVFDLWMRDVDMYRILSGRP